MIIYTYKFRIYPTESQKILINKHLGCSRFIYNYFLNKQKEFYKLNKDTNNKKFLSCFDCCNLLPELKEEFVWLKEVNS